MTHYSHYSVACHLAAGTEYWHFKSESDESSHSEYNFIWRSSVDDKNYTVF